MVIQKIIFSFFPSLMVIFLTVMTSQAGVIAPGLKSTLQYVAPNAEVSVIVILSDKADFKPFKKKKKHIRRPKIIKALKDKAALSQFPLKSFLKSNGAKRLTSFWIINGMALQVRAALIPMLASWPGVETIRLDAAISAPIVNYNTSPGIEWNLSAIEAPGLWDLGYTGQGIVVASMDTGVDMDHPDLTNKWRGGTNSWYDPNGEHATPYDAVGHGTQTMGIMVGEDAGGTAIGVAPGAEWIAVKIFDDADVATESDIHLGFQWLLDPDGDPNTDDAPDIVNNSWGLTAGLNDCIDIYQTDIQALKEAGIAVVFSAGNEGPAPSTSISPANYPETLAIGAIDDTFTIDDFSSRGPSACDGSIFPEVVAPGVSVKSSDLTFGGVFPDSYAYVTGTSYAAPHVAGAMALLKEAFPNVSVSMLESSIKQSALDLGPPGEDDAYGYGLLDVTGAYSLLFDLLNTHPYDTNQDWVIGNSELLDAIDDWMAAILNNSGLLDLLDFWTAGCYQWNSASGDWEVCSS